MRPFTTIADGVAVVITGGAHGTYVLNDVWRSTNGGASWVQPMIESESSIEERAAGVATAPALVGEVETAALADGGPPQTMSRLEKKRQRKREKRRQIRS